MEDDREQFRQLFDAARLLAQQSGFHDEDAEILASIGFSQSETDDPKKAFSIYLDNFLQIAESMGTTAYARAIVALEDSSEGRITGAAVVETDIAGRDRIVPLETRATLDLDQLSEVKGVLGELRRFILNGRFPEGPDSGISVPGPKGPKGPIR